MYCEHDVEEYVAPGSDRGKSRDSDSPAASALLAFAERLLLAKSSRQRTPSISTGLHPKADIAGRKESPTEAGDNNSLLRFRASTDHAFRLGSLKG